MKRLVFLMWAGVALWLSGCGSKEESAQQTPSSGDSAVAQTGGSAQVEIPDDLMTKPSGVRYQELLRGEGKEIVDGSYVEFDYGCWLADGSGLIKTRALAASVGRPGQEFKGQVGVHPLPGLSDGLIGMRVGGSRRVFIPQQLGYKAGTPFEGHNVIFEVVNVKEITPEEVTHYQDSVAQWLDFARRHRDSIQQALRDSLAARGLDSLGQPLDTLIGPVDTTGGR